MSPGRDLKTSNVLLTKEHLAKISDVGLACIQSGSDNTYEFAQGTFSYAAPEVVLGDKCTKAVRGGSTMTPGPLWCHAQGKTTFLR